MSTGTEVRPGTLIAAHRAGAGLWPENSIGAFRKAMRMDVDFIEFDVHRTRDGVLVVHHDPSLGRTVDGTGPICDMDWATLRHLPLRRAEGEHVPLLTSVLGLFDGSTIRPRVELKSDARDMRYTGMAADVVTVLRATGQSSRAVLTSFDSAYLDDAREAGAGELLWLLRPEPTARLASNTLDFSCEVLSRGIREIAVRGDDATPGLVAACRENGLKLGAFAGEDTNFDRLLGIGLSVFTSDRPDLALEARDRIKRD